MANDPALLEAAELLARFDEEAAKRKAIEIEEEQAYERHKERFRKDDAGKARIDLIPHELIFATAQVLELGARKYAPNNWAKGAEWSRYFSAMQRHLWAWWGGQDCDPESGRSHLAHAACCLAFLLAYENRNLGTDDRFKNEN